jgi:hypothetical protein
LPQTFWTVSISVGSALKITFIAMKTGEQNPISGSVAQIPPHGTEAKMVKATKKILPSTACARDAYPREQTSCEQDATSQTEERLANSTAMAYRSFGQEQGNCIISSV